MRRILFLWLPTVFLSLLSIFGLIATLKYFDIPVPDIISMEPSEKELIGVLIENQETARLYHTGFEKAQMIFEFVVEGGITRFGVLFDQADLPTEIGPVRSLRPYFVDALAPYTDTIFHAGGSPEAFARVESVKDLHAINALRGNVAKTFKRHADVAAPHNLFLETATMDEYLPDPYRVVPWPIYPTKNTHETTFSGATTITLNFYSSVHDVEYTYDPSAETYTRDNGGVINAMHPANVIVLEAPITDIGEFGRLTIPLSKGDGYLFRNGIMQPIQWAKNDVRSPFVFTDTNNNEIVLNDGTIWVTVLPILDRTQWTVETSDQ